MERLKTILADKILDLSSAEGIDVKGKIDKMQRFRDFANACQSLMVKYPQIEDELIKMVNDGDFDTKIASSRVDAAIRMADSKPRAGTEPQQAATEILEDVLSEQSVIEEDEVVCQPEDVDYEEVVESEDQKVDDSYVSFEPLAEKGGDEGVIVEAEVHLTDEELAAQKQKATIKKVVQIIGIVVGVVILIFVIRFVMSYWQTILIILGVAALIAILVWYFKRKQS